MYITAARHDDVIPFEGVQRYVKKLQDCIKQHKKLANGQMGVLYNALHWRKVGDS